MNLDTSAYFRQKLSQHRDALLEWLNTDSLHKDFHLGTANTHDVLHIISELKKALERIDEGDFGQCIKGDGEVEVERLELDYTTCVCLAHYSDSQLRALENELELAAKVQQQLLPSTYPDIPNVNLFVHTKPAHIVSGDYYDFLSLKNEHPAVAVADIMGKGLPASMLMSNLQATLRIIAREYEHPDALLQRLNELFLYNLKLLIVTINYSASYTLPISRPILNPLTFVFVMSTLFLFGVSIWSLKKTKVLGVFWEISLISGTNSFSSSSL